VSKRETTKITRDCPAVLVPDGHQVVIPEGSEVEIAQALGGSYTVHWSGNLARIAAENADALGKEAHPVPSLAEHATVAQVEAVVWAQLETVYDPEIPVNIVDLGLVYECRVSRQDGGYRVDIAMTLTAPACAIGDVLVAEVRDKLLALAPIASVSVELVFDPPWGPERMSEAAKLQTGWM